MYKNSNICEAKEIALLYTSYRTRTDNFKEVTMTSIFDYFSNLRGKRYAL